MRNLGINGYMGVKRPFGARPIAVSGVVNLRGSRFRAAATKVNHARVVLMGRDGTQERVTSRATNDRGVGFWPSS